MDIIFATNNPHKLHEIQALLGDSFHLISLGDLNFSEEIPENQETLEGNALEKARFIFSKYHQSCFADDTGLEVAALNGAPGVYSARYAGSVQEFGSEQKRSAANIQKLLTALHSAGNRNARFRTVIAYINSEGEEFLFEGIVNGSIIEQLRGEGGFGYDPVFVPDDYQQTFAEMPLTEKNKISHRGRAFRKYRDFLKTL
jgi:XTP/dITP diphosphohydrolase